MKVIQSFRSDAYKPLVGVVGGTAFLKADLITAGLSCVLAQKYIGPVTFYTDKLGASVVIKAGIPYNEIKVMDYLTDSRVWIEPKLRAYMVQNEPYIHIDNDMFIYQELTDYTKLPFICAHTESFRWPYYERYQAVLENILPGYFPNLIESYPAFRAPINAAIFGGTEYEEIANASRVIFNTLSDPFFKSMTDDHVDEIKQTMPFFEQYWLPIKLHNIGIDVKPLLKESSICFKTPLEVKLTHLFGLKYKEEDLLAHIMQLITAKLKQIDKNVLNSILEFTNQENTL